MVDDMMHPITTKSKAIWIIAGFIAVIFLLIGWNISTKYTIKFERV